MTNPTTNPDHYPPITTSPSPSPTPTPKNLAFILYPGFQSIDLFGPLDMLALLANRTPLNLYLVSPGPSLAPVSTAHHVWAKVGSRFGTEVVPTHTLDDVAWGDIDMVLVPGGIGARDEESADVGRVVEFVKGNEKEKKRWLLSVCTGSHLLAKAGVLDGRKATTNKRVFGWVKARHPSVHWIAKARWVADGNIWTSSGISAGIDLALAWIAHVWGEETATLLADSSEYEWNRDPENDRFAERWGAV
ncbi:class I glutamine amidotransferase-like protein [Westerdykella ornata]|uniref:Class I glutamine amidotransferase-like protein n=1 Tax=Westerdykella ornata TaxID=318751 RepID=A0A6A6J868_WESOR|nr:class I glutamine amidotransferase-like protein [Westerdykella ornata]KAF2272394.1 class I glutamine amidotransferase-like protein [Westerdykella ornata]